MKTVRNALLYASRRAIDSGPSPLGNTISPSTPEVSAASRKPLRNRLLPTETKIAPPNDWKDTTRAVPIVNRSRGNVACTAVKPC